MQSQAEKQYRVFLSYAHADAQTEAGKKLIASFKVQINEALHAVAGEDLVFLDSDALNWGDMWSVKIMECLQQCKVFVCLLSPNYQKSAYCKRERLMWERKEIRLGRLRQGTLPVYYIRLVDKTNEELRVQQADDARPFFENLDEIKENIVSEKIERVRRISEQIKDKELTEEEANSDCIGFIRISPFFVGRLGELAELCEFCKQRHLPIVVGGAGVGKTELVVAYASGYADRYPQGRFLLRMEGVKDWNHAIVKLVEDNWYAQNSIKDILALPEDYEKMPIENKRKLVLQRLWKRSEKGRLLLILDNLEKLSLVSDSGLNRLYDGVGNLPDKVDIIATSRNSDLGRAEHIMALSHKAPEYRGLPIVYEIDNLDTASVVELFCHISNNQFPFARCNPEQLRDDVSKEYNALCEMIHLLKRHVWSLEIIAAFMAEKAHSNVTFQSKLEEIKKDMSEISSEDNLSYRHIAVSPKNLMQPTFNYIKKLDFGCGIGEKILELATVAAFFPPDMVPNEALLGYWNMYYPQIQTKKFDTGEFALKQLHELHLLNGDGSVSKMHRLTREVLLNEKSGNKKVNIIKQMQQYWNTFHISHPNKTLQQLHPWIGWAEEWLKQLPVLEDDVKFLKDVGCIAYESFTNNYCLAAELLFSLVLNKSRKMKDLYLISLALSSLAELHAYLKCKFDAEREYKEAVIICRILAVINHSHFDFHLADVLSHFANFHAIYKNYRKAEYEYEEALSILRRLANSDKNLNLYVAETLNNQANFHSRFIHKNQMALSEYIEALSIYSHFAEISHEHFDSYVALTLNNLAVLHTKLENFTMAEKEHAKSLFIYRQLAELNHDRFDSSVADSLFNIANYHVKLKKINLAKCEFDEALSIYNQLAKSNPVRFKSYVARTESFLSQLDKVNEILE